MKFLVDANLSPKIGGVLEHAGYEAAHVRDHGLLAATDKEIVSHAIVNQQVIISADSDSATILALGGLRTPSLVSCARPIT